ncbi:MAG: CapA family protein [Patescibacteria group bacterium]
MISNKTIWLIIFSGLIIISGVFWWNIDRLNQGQDVIWNKNLKTEEKVVVKTELEIKEKRPLRFMFFGDVMLDRNVANVLEKKNMEELLAGLSSKDDYFKKSDIISANLEGAVTNEGKHYAPVNLYDFAFPVERLTGLEQRGFNYFTLANNHFLDQGERGVKESRENLAKENFYFSGAPDAKIDDFSRIDVKIEDKKVALIELSMVYNHFSREKAIALLSQTKNEVDLIIVNIHWGNEYEHLFNRYQQEVGHYLIEEGADIIIGHHPHVVQGMEIYQGKPIFYSLGNFIFDQYFSIPTQTGLALYLEIDEEELIFKFFPFSSKQSAPTFKEDKIEIENFLNDFISWSEIDQEYSTMLKSGVLEVKR